MLLNKTQSIFIACGVLLLFFVVVALATSSAGKKLTARNLSEPQIQMPTPSAQITPDNQAASSFALQRFNRSETRDGKKLWEVAADSGQYSPETKQALLFKAKMQLYKDGQPQVEIQSDQADLVIDGATLSSAAIKGNVILNYQNQLSVKGARAELDRTSNLVSSDSAIVIEAQGLKIEGAKMKANIADQILFLSGGVTTTLIPAARRKNEVQN